ncbi:cytochrome P450 2K1 [Austrofundulus limnaeus]|uniref:Cytochrome P450 2K1 n=1 Tax=Austrofundulus limnaeus TaxID=52670 RepID=A0A2I4C7K4_AUSLI|nr:PREDICTED: cytochrome P450 2K1-like [Austrofundulus limnaeus]
MIMAILDILLDLNFYFLFKGLVVSLLIYLVYVSITRSKVSRKEPPGPTPLPLLGNLLQLDLKKPFNTFLEFSKVYGSVFTVYFGCKKVVVLAGYRTVKEALIKYDEEFGESDVVHIMDELNRGHGKDTTGLNYLGKLLVATNGETWKEMCRFSVTNLRDFGIGKKACEEKLIEECYYLIDVFKCYKGEITVINKQLIKCWFKQYFIYFCLFFDSGEAFDTR